MSSNSLKPRQRSLGKETADDDEEERSRQQKHRSKSSRTFLSSSRRNDVVSSTSYMIPPNKSGTTPSFKQLQQQHLPIPEMKKKKKKKRHARNRQRSDPTAPTAASTLVDREENLHDEHGWRKTAIKSILQEPSTTSHDAQDEDSPTFDLAQKNNQQEGISTNQHPVHVHSSKELCHALKSLYLFNGSSISSSDSSGGGLGLQSFLRQGSPDTTTASSSRHQRHGPPFKILTTPSFGSEISSATEFPNDCYHDCSLNVLRKRARQRFRVLESMAAQGDAHAQFEAGKCWDHANGTSQSDPDQAFQYYKLSAQQGHPGAQYELATCFKRGHGTRKNASQAEYWYQQAYQRSRELCEERNPLAQFYYGLCHFYLQEDEVTAFHWYKLSAEQGFQRAMFVVADMILATLSSRMAQQHNLSQEDINESTALAYLHQAAEMGHRQSQHRLGLLYRDGECGLHRNYSTSVMWLANAAVQGDAMATLELTRLAKDLQHNASHQQGDHDMFCAVEYCIANGIGEKPGTGAAASLPELYGQDSSAEFSVPGPIGEDGQISTGGDSPAFRIQEQHQQLFASRVALDHEIEQLEEVWDEAGRSHEIAVIRQGIRAERRLPRLRALRRMEIFKLPTDQHDGSIALEQETWLGQNRVKTTDKPQQDQDQERFHREDKRHQGLNRQIDRWNVRVAFPRRKPKQSPSRHVNDQIWQPLPFGWKPFDVFLIHSGSQRKIAIKGLKDCFKGNNLNSFLDGDMETGHGSPNEFMEFALETCRYSVAVISRDFLTGKHPCAELVYSFKRMMWIRQETFLNAWQSLYVVLLDMTVADFKVDYPKSPFLGEIGDSFTDEIQMISLLEDCESWNNLQSDLTQQLQSHDIDNDAIGKWLHFLEHHWGEEGFDKADQLYLSTKQSS